MKSLLVALTVCLGLLSPSASRAADERNVTVVNGTGYGIKFLGFNNPGDNDWSDNEVSNTFKDGDNVYVKFNTDDKGCKWNIRVDWADAGYPGVLWRNVDLCEIDEITLHYDRGSDQTSITTK